ncbi:CDP-alcohol phosphatidyltransferase family protein [Phenylobacterium sp.]|uniref:CDP-alcohol phosphatidyltransferase family protein n=1 Tax=Phenylobacterium sp. TaxID=1871053 RepID=UPI0035AE6B30
MAVLSEQAAGGRPLGIVVGSGAARIWGMTGAERLRRMFVRAGLEPAGAADPGRAAVIARGDWVIDESLLKAVAQRPATVLVAPGGVPVAAHAAAGQGPAVAELMAAGAAPAGLKVLDPEALSYNEALRKKEPPVLEPLTEANVRAVEARTFQGSYKGVTDIVTKYAWPLPARIVTRWCALARMTPNQVTFVGFLLVLAAFWLFWVGEYGWGLVCAWIMTFLDTVDGKLARVTLTSSKFGNIFDHGIDLIHPPFWWWAWYVGLQQTGQLPPDAGLMLGIILIGYWVQRGIEGVFMRRFGFHVHSWRPFDSFFRLITARRNPNLLILTPATLLGAPGYGFWLMGAWTAISLAVHVVQLAKAFMTPRDQVVSWLSR